MIDALLYAFRDACDVNNGSPLRYDHRTMDIMPDGRPKPMCGPVFLAIHPGPDQNVGVENLSEYFAVHLTLTMKILIPGDATGSHLLAAAITPQLLEETGFNQRADSIRAFFNKNWEVIEAANEYLCVRAGAIGQESVYGFSESPVYNPGEPPYLVGESWFKAEPPKHANQYVASTGVHPEVGIAQQLEFNRIFREQPVGLFV